MNLPATEPFPMELFVNFSLGKAKERELRSFDSDEEDPFVSRSSCSVINFVYADEEDGRIVATFLKPMGGRCLALQDILCKCMVLKEEPDDSQLAEP